MGLRLVIDDAVAWQTEAFGHLAQLHAMPGPSIDRSALASADALVVRSVTRVTAELVQGTPVRFVGTATAGEDHIEREALESRGITVANAPGCNAQAVAEYVVSALAHACEHRVSAPPGPVGVVGLGHVGRRTVRALRALGYDVMVSDPPLAERRAAKLPIHDPDPSLANMARYERLSSLDALLDSSFVISLHVPLVFGGPNPTWHLFDAARLSRLRHGQLLLNTSRGGVVDDGAMVHWLGQGSGRAVLDVWEGEPRLRPELLDPSAGLVLATPHVAGYSLEGKVAATRMVHEALCRFLGRPPDFDGRAVLGPRGTHALRCDHPDAAHDWRPWVRAAIPIRDDEAALRATMQQPVGERPSAFEALRRGHRLRRELSAFSIPDAVALDPDTHMHLGALGLGVPPEPTAPPVRPTEPTG
ncbi:4-phosphoerythronate dehydrogenase [Paraliomyxa miuraensis]|uniref:4-phosphoerythronate dehydrogenase n=1 Tax=Paraliomyxa miuraensis TaxID=376150 RepID=UPI002259C004|nr:4-phosphoerythronate dehydrogenase [Paraliomyxa miuraensis]MCX4239549.1 4-phosphoerythronate dehydrogenase [Paraliomyxa miuraensis]